jgi:hypothetical protein
VITTQPQSQQAPCHGTVTFTVEASGTAPLTYQWIANQTVIVNATNASLTLTNLGLSDNGPYRVYVSNPVGSTNSLDALLVVQDSALVSLQVHRDGTNLVVSWPRSCTAFQLEENQTLDPATWSPIAVPIQDTDTLRTATIPIATPYKFYRLGN